MQIQKIGNIKIHRRVGLAVIAFAAVLPVGLSAIGNAQSAQTAALYGFPIVLLAAIAWRGRVAAQSKTPQKRRVLRQKQFVVVAAFGLLCSVLVSDWPREAAFKASVALNRDAVITDACDSVGWQFSFERRIGLVRISHAEINGYGDVFLYSEETGRDGKKWERQARVRSTGAARKDLP